jgi:arylsulfatase A-like enzyme
VTQRQKDNLFLWVDCFDPHEPWNPPSPYREMYDPDYDGKELIDPVPGPVDGYMTEEELRHTKALYAGEVTFVDTWLGVLLDRIRDLGLYDNSLIVFMSDHGEPFGDHGIVRKSRPWNYEELAHIPWLMRMPEGLGQGERFASFIQPPDLMPTILEMLGISTPLTLPYTGNERDLAGRSLLPLLNGETDSIRDFAVTAHYGKQWGYRTDRWTYLYNLDGSRPELYDRQADPREQHDLWAAHQEVGDALELRLRRFADKVG